MDNINPTSSAIPPQIHAPRSSGLEPLGENPDDRQPIPNAVAAIEAILRQPRRVMFQLRQPGSGRLILFMIFIVLALVSFIAGLMRRR